MPEKSFDAPQVVVNLAGYFLNERMKAAEARAVRMGIDPENLWDQFPQVRSAWMDWAATMACDVLVAVRKEWGSRE